MNTTATAPPTESFPAVPERFYWEIRQVNSSTDKQKTVTMLLLCGDGGATLVDYRSIITVNEAGEGPSEDHLRSVAESMLEKTSTKAALGLIAPLQ